MSTGRLFTLLRYAPREGAFVMSVEAEEAEAEEAEATPKVKRRATIAETAAAFGMKIPAKG